MFSCCAGKKLKAVRPRNDSQPSLMTIQRKHSAKPGRETDSHETSPNEGGLAGAIQSNSTNATADLKFTSNEVSTNATTTPARPSDLDYLQQPTGLPIVKEINNSQQEVSEEELFQVSAQANQRRRNESLKTMSIKSPYFQHPVRQSTLANSEIVKQREQKFRRMGTTDNRLMSNKSFTQAVDCIDFADGSERATSSIRLENFSKKNRFQCTFCLGKACSKEQWQKCKEPIIHGLHSNLIADKCIGSQRPSTRKVEKYGVTQQLLDLNVGIMVNLQEPGEHSLCGDGIINKVGFSYDPEMFQKAGIATFNWYWEDLTCPTNELTLTICQNMSRFDQMGKRIFVHCHAGTGRTGLVIASFLYFSKVAATAQEAVTLVKTQRPGSLKRKSQEKFVIAFCAWLDEKRKSFFPDEELKEEASYCQMMQTNLQLVHGKDLEDYKYFPKLLGVCLKKLKLHQITVQDFNTRYLSFKSLEVKPPSMEERQVQQMKLQIQEDRWELLDSVANAAVCLEGIFHFLKPYTHPVPPTQGATAQKSQIELRRLQSYRLGLLHFFASLIQHLDASDDPDGQALEQCFTFCASLVPTELQVVELTKKSTPAETKQATIAQMKEFHAQLESTNKSLMSSMIQRQVSKVMDTGQTPQSQTALALRQLTRTFTIQSRANETSQEGAQGASYINNNQTVISEPPILGEESQSMIRMQPSSDSLMKIKVVNQMSLMTNQDQTGAPESGNVSIMGATQLQNANEQI